MPFFITLSGIGMSVVGPHAVPLRSEGFVRVAFFTLMRVSGGAGVHPVTFV